jgi:hypothetical protein
MAIISTSVNVELGVRGMRAMIIIRAWCGKFDILHDYHLSDHSLCPFMMKYGIHVSATPVHDHLPSPYPTRRAIAPEARASKVISRRAVCHVWNCTYQSIGVLFGCPLDVAAKQDIKRYPSDG